MGILNLKQGIMSYREAPMKINVGEALLRIERIAPMVLLSRKDRAAGCVLNLVLVPSRLVGPSESFQYILFKLGDVVVLQLMNPKKGADFVDGVYFAFEHLERMLASLRTELGEIS